MGAKTIRTRRGRPAGKPLSRRELAARRKNLLRARSAPKELIYRSTDKRLRASLHNLRRAIAERRRDSGPVRLNALKHGVYSRELTWESVGKLGESLPEFDAHHKLLARMFVPRTPDENLMVWELANLAWRRLRLFRAAAERERRDLRALAGNFADADANEIVDAGQTLQRMYLLFATLDGCDRVVRDAAKLRQEMRGFFELLVEARTPAGEIAVQPRWDPPLPPLANPGLLEWPEAADPLANEIPEGGEEFKDEV